MGEFKNGDAVVHDCLICERQYNPPKKIGEKILCPFCDTYYILEIITGRSSLKKPDEPAPEIEPVE